MANAFDYASLAVLNALLAAFVLRRSRASWLGRALALLFAVNIVTPTLNAFGAAGASPSSTVVDRISDAQSVASLVLLALLPALVYREATGRGSRLAVLLAGPTIVASAIYLAVRYALPGEAMTGRTFLLLNLTPWVFVVVGGLVALLDLAVRAREAGARRRAHFFLAAYVLATMTTLGFPLRFGDYAGWEAALVQALSFALLCGLALPIATVGIQRLRALAGKTAAPPLAPTEWILVLATPAVALYLASASEAHLGYGLARPILLTSGILWAGIAGEGRAERALAAAVVVVAAGATSIWVEELSGAPALAPLVGVGLALLLLWPLAREALGQSAPQGRTLYEAALASSLASGAPGDAKVLATLRERLGISDKEHGLLEMRLRERGPLAPATLLFGRYRIERRLGAGASGATYLAHDEQLRRPVSLKVAQLPHDEAGEKLLVEARALARLRHPNIPRLLDVERIGHDVLLVMEYVEGEPLDARLRRGPLPVDEGVRIAEDVLSALATLHREGLVHRDIKPSNVVLAKDGRAYLIDFGIAADMSRTLTQSGAAVPAGTLAYMAPEQLKGGVVDPRSDLFSLGATLYESLCGETYFPMAGRDAQEIAAAVTGDRARWPQQLPRPLAGWLMRALEKDPAERPASATEMLGELRRVAA